MAVKAPQLDGVEGQGSLDRPESLSGPDGEAELAVHLAGLDVGVGMSFYAGRKPEEDRGPAPGSGRQGVQGF